MDSWENGFLLLMGNSSKPGSINVLPRANRCFSVFVASVSFWVLDGISQELSLSAPGNPV